MEDLKMLSTNSKPVINMLSQVAEEHVNLDSSAKIVSLIVTRHKEVKIE